MMDVVRSLHRDIEDIKRELAEERAARKIDRAEIDKLEARWRGHYRVRVGLMMMLRHPEMTAHELAREVSKSSAPADDPSIEELASTLATARELVQQRVSSAVDAVAVPLSGALRSARDERDSLLVRIAAERKIGEEAQALAVEATIALAEAREKIADLESQLACRSADESSADRSLLLHWESCTGYATPYEARDEIAAMRAKMAELKRATSVPTDNGLDAGD